MRALCALGGVALGATSACVPSDEALSLGSVQFSFMATAPTEGGLSETETADGWAFRFDRVVLGFKTMTIGTPTVAGRCASRGSGATSDVVFDPRVGIVQTLNGIVPAQCEAGIVFGPPGLQTLPTAGATGRDLVDLASGAPAHAIVEATATLSPRFAARARPSSTHDTLRILLRFDSERTPTTFGGCQGGGRRGVTVLAGERDRAVVRFSAETLFRADPYQPNVWRVSPFAQADRAGNDDGVVTMDELDALAPTSLGLPPLPTPVASFGDVVRFLFGFAFTFRDDGSCVGVEPGSL